MESKSLFKLYTRLPLYLLFSWLHPGVVLQPSIKIKSSSHITAVYFPSFVSRPSYRMNTQAFDGFSWWEALTEQTTVITLLQNNSLKWGPCVDDINRFFFLFQLMVVSILIHGNSFWFFCESQTKRKYKFRLDPRQIIQMINSCVEEIKMTKWKTGNICIYFQCLFLH